jgi:hypothetical protein
VQLNPGDVLSLIVEVCVAIAGFSGIVIVLGRRQSGEWTSVDRLRLDGLLNASVAPMSISGLALILLASRVPSDSVWWICSGVYAVLYGLFWARYMRRAAKLTPEETNRTQMVTVAVSGTATILLLAANALLLHAFWPLAVGLSYHVGLALFNFFGLLQRAVSDGEAA